MYANSSHQAFPRHMGNFVTLSSVIDVKGDNIQNYNGRGINEVSISLNVQCFDRKSDNPLVFKINHEVLQSSENQQQDPLDLTLVPTSTSKQQLIGNISGKIMAGFRIFMKIWQFGQKRHMHDYPF